MITYMLKIWKCINNTTKDYYYLQLFYSIQHVVILIIIPDHKANISKTQITLELLENVRFIKEVSM